jgi:cytochrome P450
MNDLAIPEHVPADLVTKDYPFVMGLTTDKNPFTEIVNEMHKAPDVIYATNAYPIDSPAWIPRRTELVQSVYLDEEHFSSENLSPFPMLTGGDWKVTPVEIDSPHHAKYRNVLTPVFTPKNLALLDEKVRLTARDFIAEFKNDGECEFMRDFAMRFPIAVFLDLMGLPQERMAQFLKWESMLLHSVELESIIEGTQQVVAYLREVIADRKQNPCGDLVSLAVEYEYNGEKLNDDELLGICFEMFIGGLDTVTTNIAWQVRHLAEHLDDQKKLRENPELIGNAVENLYRRYAAVTTYRTCIKQTTLGDVTIMPGDKVAVSTTLANNDPAKWNDPSAMDFSKPPRHITFGYGVHRCVGAALARRESVVALEELFEALPVFKVKPGVELHTELGPILQPKNLPLVW